MEIKIVNIHNEDKYFSDRHNILGKVFEVKCYTSSIWDNFQCVETKDGHFFAGVKFEIVNQTEIDKILFNPSVSYWLKDIVKTGSERDLVDVISDLESAVNYFRNQWKYNNGLLNRNKGGY